MPDRGVPTDPALVVDPLGQGPPFRTGATTSHGQLRQLDEMLSLHPRPAVQDPDGCGERVLEVQARHLVRHRRVVDRRPGGLESGDDVAVRGEGLWVA